MLPHRRSPATGGGDLSGAIFAADLSQAVVVATGSAFDFLIPDTHGRLSAARDDIGGGGAGRLPSMAGGSRASVGGGEGRLPTLANLPIAPPGGSVTVTYPGRIYEAIKRK